MLRRDSAMTSFNSVWMRADQRFLPVRVDRWVRWAERDITTPSCCLLFITSRHLKIIWRKSLVKCARSSRTQKSAVMILETSWKRTQKNTTSWPSFGEAWLGVWKGKRCCWPHPSSSGTWNMVERSPKCTRWSSSPLSPFSNLLGMQCQTRGEPETRILGRPSLQIPWNW